MLSPILTIACKELLDGWRDRRAMLSAALYCLMGPAVVGMVSVGIGGNPAVLIAMMSVFTLVSAFTGGMNVAMDSIAGERERRSLLPLLMHPISRLQLILGKWLAIAVFSIAGLALDLGGFAFTLHRWPSAGAALSLAPLCLFAAALELLCSTLCRGIKEAHTYLSMLVFFPMGVGMFMVFSPVARIAWWGFLPVAGQQLQLEAAMRGGALDLGQILLPGIASTVLAAAALVTAAHRLERDDVVYGS